MTVETTSDATTVINGVRSAIQYACDHNIFIESSSFEDLVHVRYLGPASTNATETQNATAKSSSSSVQYEWMGVLLGIISFLIIFLTIWCLLDKKRRREQTNSKENKSIATSKEENGSNFTEPEYGNLGKHIPTQDVHRCMSMMCEQCLHQQQPTFLPTKIQQHKENKDDLASI